MSQELLNEFSNTKLYSICTSRFGFHSRQDGPESAWRSVAVSDVESVGEGRAGVAAADRAVVVGAVHVRDLVAETETTLA